MGGLLFALALLAPSAASAQQPLLTFVQMSDSQPVDSADQARFELVLDTIAEAGQPGALLPLPVDLVLFAGDLVWNSGNESERRRSRTRPWRVPAPSRPRTWVEFDVTSAVTGTGLFSFGLTSDSSNSALYSSREGGQPPELIVQTAP